MQFAELGLWPAVVVVAVGCAELAELADSVVADVAGLRLVAVAAALAAAAAVVVVASHYYEPAAEPGLVVAERLSEEVS